MGAATALMYCGSQSSRTQNQNDILPISGMVLDSPFSSLQCVAQELVDAYGVRPICLCSDYLPPQKRIISRSFFVFSLLLSLLSADCII
jgi:hypothetical protein